MLDSEPAWYERRPRLVLALAAPIVVALVIIATMAFVRAHTLGERPSELSAKAAIERAHSSGVVWTHLADGRFECPRVEDRRVQRYVRVLAPSLDGDAIIAVVREGASCPPTASVVGLVAPATSTVYRDAVSERVPLPNLERTFTLAIYSGPSNERALAATALGFAVLAAFVGAFGYVARGVRSDRDARVARSALPREQVLRALVQPPLVLRSAIRATATLGFLGVGALMLAGFVVLAIELTQLTYLLRSGTTITAAFAEHAAALGTAAALVALGAPTLFWMQARFARGSRVLMDPQVEWAEVVGRADTEIEGIVVATVYSIRIRAGRPRTVSVPTLHPAIVDDEGRILVVVPRSDPDAQPIAVGVDGYPFVIQ